MDEQQSELYGNILFFAERDGRTLSDTEARFINRMRERHPAKCRRIESRMAGELARARTRHRADAAIIARHSHA